MPLKRRAIVRSLLAAVVAVAGVILAQLEAGDRGAEAVTSPRWSVALDEAWVETPVTIYRLLADDNEGSRHQRLLARAPDGHSLLIVHNIDLAERIPAREGDELFVRGQFEWTDKGGLIHWTHHDPQGRHAGGYIDHRGERYR